MHLIYSLLRFNICYFIFYYNYFFYSFLFSGNWTLVCSICKLCRFRQGIFKILIFIIVRKWSKNFGSDKRIILLAFWNSHFVRGFKTLWKFAFCSVSTFSLHRMRSYPSGFLPTSASWSCLYFISLIIFESPYRSSSS